MKSRCGWVLQKGTGFGFNRISDIADRYEEIQCSDDGIHEDSQPVGCFKWTRWLCDFHKCWRDRMREKHLEWDHEEGLTDNHHWDLAADSRLKNAEFEEGR